MRNTWASTIPLMEYRTSTAGSSSPDRTSIPEMNEFIWPDVPKSVKKPMARTRGGKMNGTVVRERRADLPGNLYLFSRYAPGTARMMVAAVDINACSIVKIMILMDLPSSRTSQNSVDVIDPSDDLNPSRIKENRGTRTKQVTAARGSKYTV